MVIVQTVTIADYDPSWPVLFEQLRKRVLENLDGMVVAVEHVGSTSVPHLPAKPLIDFDVVVRPDDVPAAMAALERLGYRHQGDLGVKGREAFRWTAQGPEHHLYVCPQGSPAFHRHLLVRDYLRKHPEEARRYAELKRQLAERYHDNRTEYQEAKAEFVDALMKKAELEAR
jgi:GrpB-like predicted nucleotidyltransferase (UPF0157 family)